MTKAAFVSIGLIFLLATATTSRAQNSPTQEAIGEAVRRQADVITLRQKLGQAAAAEARKDLPVAAKLYEDSYKLVVGIGPGYNIESETAQTILGLTTVRMELARAAQKRGDLKEVDTQVTRVLRVSPKDPQAIELKKTNDKALAEMAGRIPSDGAREQVAAARKDMINAGTLVQDGRILLEAGKLDLAEAKLKEAIKIDPENQSAFYYLSLVKERRYNEAERRREQDSKDTIVKIEQAWERPATKEKLPVPNPYARTNMIFTGKGRQAIVSKLDRIRMESVMYDGLGLGEVMRTLNEEARKRDPDKRGINFLINPNAEAAAATPGVTTVDPTTGLPVPAPPVEPVDIETVAIKINPALTDVRLADVLDAIVKVADKPIKYSIEEYAVVFSQKGFEPTPLSVRIFKVDPNTFLQGLESVNAFPFGNIQTSSGSGGGGGGGFGGGGGGGFGGGGGQQGGQGLVTVPRVEVSSGSSGISGGGGGIGGGGGGGGGGGLRFITRTNSMEGVSAAVREFFLVLGVDLTPGTGKSLFWNDRDGTLLVRATMQDLDTIEAAIQVLNITPHQVNIKAKFAEVSQEDIRGIGFDWYFGNFFMGGKSVVASGGTQPTLQGAPSTANPQGFFPGTSAGTTIPSASSDQLITGGLRTSSDTASLPSLATITGILTDPQFRVVIKAIEQRSGVDLLSSPEVTTVSGRQAQVTVLDLRTVVTGTQFDTGQQSTASVSTGGGTSVNPNQAVFNQPITQILPFGPVLDVIPYISADGYTVQMTIIPTVTEFVGYDDPGPFVPEAVTGGGIPVESVLPLPRFRVRQVTTSAVVWDGQTVVLGGLLSENMARIKDKVPVLGDLPFVGKLFRSEASKTEKKNLLIFVTPTIIDPSGNRLHSEDEMPFAQTSVPPQPAGSATATP